MKDKDEISFVAELELVPASSNVLHVKRAAVYALYTLVYLQVAIASVEHNLGLLTVIFGVAFAVYLLGALFHINAIKDE